MDSIAVGATGSSTTTTIKSRSSMEEPSSVSSPAMKRLACESCRDRKIRCDRQHPTCGRCARMGNACRYSTRSKSTPSKSDLSRYLKAMNQRLQQTEAQLALHAMQSAMPSIPGEATVTQQIHALPTPPPGTGCQSAVSTAVSSSQETPYLLPSPLDLFDLGIAAEEESYSMSEWARPVASNDNHNVAEFSMEEFPMPLVTPPLMPESQPPFELEPEPLRKDVSPSISESSLPELSTGLLHSLYNKYFDLFHPILPILSRTRFENEISRNAPSIGARALSWAIATLGSFSIPELRCHVDRCYDQCRALLELCERQYTGESLANLNTLQALVLLTLYEINQENFARSYMTLGRAIRLAKMMALDQGACCLLAGVTATQWGPSLPPPTSAADAEERRRTYWALFVFDAVSTMQTNATSALEKPAQIPLPYSSDYPDDLGQPCATMPYLQQAFDPDMPDDIAISPFAGTIIVMWLYRRCMEHMSSQLSQGPSAPPFWETHYAIEKAITQCQTKMLARYVDGDRADDARSLILRMNLAAVKISLHETALAKVEAGQLPAALVVDATSKCASAAADIAKAVQLGKSLTGKKLETFRQQDRFLVWPMTTAILVLVRLLEKKQKMNEIDIGAQQHCFDVALRVLCRAMRDLIRPEHVRVGLMSEVEARLAAGRSSCSQQERERELEAEDDLQIVMQDGVTTGLDNGW